MLRRFYRADYIDKSGNIQTFYSFEAGTDVKAVIGALRYKQGVSGCDYCKLKAIITLTGKGYPESEPEPKRPRGWPRKYGINKKNRDEFIY